MKRHPGLAALSREHHHALVMSQALRRGAPERLRASYPRDPQALVDAVRHQFRVELEPHFQMEERVLIPLCEGRSDPLVAQAARIEREHHELRKMLAEVTVGASLTDQLDAFARLLEDHVRFEERTWFPNIEETLDGQVLNELAEQLSPSV